MIISYIYIISRSERLPFLLRSISSIIASFLVRGPRSGHSALGRFFEMWSFNILINHRICHPAISWIISLTISFLLNHNPDLYNPLINQLGKRTGATSNVLEMFANNLGSAVILLRPWQQLLPLHPTSTHIVLICGSRIFEVLGDVLNVKKYMKSALDKKKTCRISSCKTLKACPIIVS